MLTDYFDIIPIMIPKTDFVKANAPLIVTAINAARIADPILAPFLCSINKLVGNARVWLHLGEKGCITVLPFP